MMKIINLLPYTLLVVQIFWCVYEKKKKKKNSEYVKKKIIWKYKI